MDQPLLGLQQSWFKHFKKWTLVIKQATTQNHPQPAKTTQNHHQLPKITHNQMVWTFHISGRKIFSLFYLILQLLENNLHSSGLCLPPPPPPSFLSGGGGFIFKWGVCPMGGHQFWWGGVQKNHRMGGCSSPRPPCPPHYGKSCSWLMYF